MYCPIRRVGSTRDLTDGTADHTCDGIAGHLSGHVSGHHFDHHFDHVSDHVSDHLFDHVSGRVGDERHPTIPRGRWAADITGHQAGPRRPHLGATAGQHAGSDGRALVETVALLEAAAIALGAADLSAASIRTARAADRELRACRHDPATAIRWARLFHHTLLNACPNRHMLDLIDVETSGGSRGHRLTVGLDELSRVSDDHEAILDMIATGAPRSELERCLRRHASTSTLCSMALLGG